LGAATDIANVLPYCVNVEAEMVIVHLAELLPQKYLKQLEDLRLSDSLLKIDAA
jgi:hypothetical protein